MKHGITYPLLSDEGSRIIRKLGLLNEHIAEQHAHYGVPVRDHHYGVPYPGVFVLDEDGIVLEKRFDQSYRVRPQAVSFLESGIGGESALPPVRAHVETDEVRIVAWLGASTYRPYQKLLLNLDVQIAQGLHVFGRPIAQEYTPLTVTLDPLEALEVGSLAMPTPSSLRIEELGETFPIYAGNVHGTLPFILTKNLGGITVAVRVRYQACSDSECYFPREVTLRLPLTGLDNIRD